ncbi:phosphatase PAP2 family protein [Nonomuraea rhizosphaerae]|uniref:phosphatase PAP2 family protein n=1 Tax=Nonomuraea rhizosphaerae TaxID=2665663 RepID=UPI001C5F1E74|nr:phosphatase PAP2 family protein [Nonomuraea rhizosphaerae]
MDLIEELHRAELAPIVWLQGLPGEPVMRAVTLLGTQGFFLFLVPVLYWCVSPRLGLRLGVTVLAAAWANAVAKLLFHQPRPYWIDARVRPLAVEPSFGLPSGHAQNSVAAWGQLVRGRAAWCAAGLLIGLVCLSRLYLGVHFVSDVAGGLLLGLAVLGLVRRLEGPVSAWWRKQRLWRQLAAAAALSAVMPVVAALANAPHAGWRPPLAPGASEAESLTTVAVMAGGLFGLLAGASIMRGIGWFDVDGPARVKCARWALGGAVSAIIWYVLGTVLPPTGISSFVQYAALSLWVHLGAPVMFIRLGLMSRATPAGGVQ